MPRLGCDQAARETLSATLTPSTAAGGADGERCTGWPVALAQQGRWPRAFAEFERTMIRQRIKAGLKRAIAQGVKLGRPKIDSATERKVRNQLAKGVGILKVASRPIQSD